MSETPTTPDEFSSLLTRLSNGTEKRYWPLVPKDYRSNLQFRSRILTCGSELRPAIRAACKADILFWVNAFCWIFEPRSAREHPFITYPYQDDLLLSVLTAIEKGQDLVIEKSRDVGATWCVIAAKTWLWQFHGRSLFLMLSRTEDLVESDEQKSLFWKHDYLLDNQPHWLLPRKRKRTTMHSINRDSGASIDGDSTNKFAGVAARYRAVYLDEFSKMREAESINKGLRDVTDCRIYSFTPEGVHNTATKLAKSAKFKKKTVHWSLHPQKRKGLYLVAEDGKLELLDKEFWTPDGKSQRTGNRYKFVRLAPKNPRFKYRSPWYDAQCNRAINDIEIATELDIDYRGSEYQFFDSAELERLAREHCRLPLLTGTLFFDDYSLEPQEVAYDPMGDWQFWIPTDGGLRPADDRNYVLGIDISWGTGASNSVISVGDCKTREKVAEWASSRTKPETAARIAIAAAKWFSGIGRRGAFMIWEVNGPGVPFGDVVLAHGYGNVYMNTPRGTLKYKPQDKPGWQPGGNRGDAKTSLLTEYRAMLYSGQYINRSEQAIRECHEIIHLDGGGIGHAEAETTEDVTNARSSHADRVIADALVCKGMGGYRARQAVVKKAVISETEMQQAILHGCMAARDQKQFDEEHPVDEW